MNYHSLKYGWLRALDRLIRFLGLTWIMLSNKLIPKWLRLRYFRFAFENLGKVGCIGKILLWNWEVEQSAPISCIWGCHIVALFRRPARFRIKFGRELNLRLSQRKYIQLTKYQRKGRSELFQVTALELYTIEFRFISTLYEVYSRQFFQAQNQQF
jgi:hypothetical protein